MQPNSGEFDTKVAVLVDCENADPDILDYALRVAAQFGRVVLRRGFGSHTALANKWQTVLVQQAFTPCLQYAYAAGKNTSDIALAMAPTGRSARRGRLLSRFRRKPLPR